MKAGTIGIPDTPADLQASSTLFGVGTIGAAGAIGGNKPTGKLVENGGRSCMKTPIVWTFGNAKDPQTM